ncbi:MAG TPA: NeuD/PglB/VioB family sugar acetyltransferase [Phenylobacterium sp.]|nr:NeuD/PglB/VioB family sugar acetyltransferase [Phenylobacterium sp.]
MKPLVMVGGGPGSLPRIIIEAVEAQGRALAGYLDVGEDPQPLMHPRPRLGDVRLLDEPAFRAAHDFAVAVQGPQRRAICLKLLEAVASLPPILHPAATVSATATLGAGTVVSAGVVVQQDARIGRFCMLNTSCSIDHDNLVGDFVSVSPGVRTAGSAQIGDEAFVGLGALIIGGVKVGRRATVGAGAVVIRDVPEGVTVVGNPARPLPPKD